nr:hypothetical protein [Escherichia coli]
MEDAAAEKLSKTAQVTPLPKDPTQP